MSFSNWVEEQIPPHIFRTGSFSKTLELAVALLTPAPDGTSTGQFSIFTTANHTGTAQIWRTRWRISRRCVGGVMDG